MDVVGITGTNGKTTTAFLMEGAMQSSERSTGVVGTVLTRWPGHVESLGMTTPDAIALHSLFGRMSADGVDTAVMEVSSHALDQHRVDAVDFDVAAFTNLGRDHLDYHGSLLEYAAAKRRFFTEVLPAGSHPRGAVINVDDAAGDALAGECGTPVVRMGRAAGPGRDLYAADIHSSLGGIEATIVSDWGRAEVHSSLVGEHNLMNVLTAVGCGLLLDVSLDDLVSGIGGVAHVPGRLQSVPGAEDFHILVDYAHTDDALTATLSSLKPLTPGRLIVVFGCGGDRDPGKRALMGAVVARYADVAIVTSDNPRTEDPESIIADVVAGLDGFPALGANARRGYLLVVDRGEAIHRAIEIASPGDVVLLAGKGHEATQELADRVIAFDDTAVAMEALASRGGGR
jgi:UDP-N-acetylmuramyl-tripeptide synthetase